jgi:hypothetical protein
VDLITRLPGLIKVQHNATSNATAYPLSLPRIMHEYAVLWRKRHRVTVAGPQPPPAGPGV